MPNIPDREQLAQREQELARQQEELARIRELIATADEARAARDKAVAAVRAELVEVQARLGDTDTMPLMDVEAAAKTRRQAEREYREAIIAANRAGVSLERIAEAAGVSLSTVHRIKQKEEEQSAEGQSPEG